jgi:sugar lactone lactonase YvrE
MLSRDVDVAIRSDALLGEGPRWDAATGRLLWVDIEGRALHLWDPRTGEDRVVPLPNRVGAAAPTTDGAVLVALADRLALVDLRDESLCTLAAFPHGEGIRTNDGTCDSAGRFWIGTMALDFAPGAGALYRYSGGVLERILDDVTLSNGLGWSPDGRSMYFIDSLTFRIDVFDFDADDGSITGRRPFVAIDPADGTPDGLAVDDEGGVWVALYGGSAVRRYSPEGDLERVLAVPAKNVTACCFGGDGRRSLFITTAAPAGSVFVTDVGVSGPSAQPFRSTAPSAADPTSRR